MKMYVSESGKTILARAFKLDSSSWLLLISNIITIFIAVIERWSLYIIMTVYLCQGIIIGMFNFIRILQLKEFEAKGLKINGKPAETGSATKNFVAFFFLVHYGLFHLIYSSFILPGLFLIEKLNLFWLLASIAIFFVNHYFSFFYNLEQDK